MNQVPFDVGLQLGANNAFLHQVNRALKQVFQIELQAEIAFCRRAAFEFDHYVNIAAFLRLVTRGRAEQRQVGDAKTPHQFRFVLGQQFRRAPPPIAPPARPR